MASRSEVTIGDFVFYVKKFPALEALRIVGNLQKRVIGPASKLIATMKGEEADISDDAFAEGIKALSEALDGDTLLWAFKTLVQPDYVSFVPTGADAEKLTETAVAKYDLPLDVLVMLAVEVAKINYMGFGKSAGGLIGLVRSRITN